MVLNRHPSRRLPAKHPLALLGRVTRSVRRGSIVPPMNLALDSIAGRRAIAAAAIGSGMGFLDGSVVNAALPAIRKDFGGGLAGQQWVVTGYLLTLGSLLVVGGALGDRFGRRRMYVIGLVGFSTTSALCGIAPGIGVLAAARLLQGVAGALMVPASLAMLSSVFAPSDRAAAIGRWSGLAGVATALGPFLGGWLIDIGSWRWIFLINVPLAVVAARLAVRWVPDTRSDDRAPLDFLGAGLLSFGLAGVVYALVEGPGAHWRASDIGVGVGGVVLLVAFVVVEATRRHPMVPLSLFSNRTFAGTNLVTFVVWGAIGAVFFLLTLQLQTTLGYSALEAGAASLPISVSLLLFSQHSGALAQRIGPRLQMTVGPMLIGVGFALLSRVQPGRSYLTTVLPGILVLACGMTATVAPLTATVLGAVSERHSGLGSAINNATARIASLLAIAALPAATGLDTNAAGSIATGFSTAMFVCGTMAIVGGVIAWATIRNPSR
jgi:EmrB/QacA subfamily drug resistance transporter